MDLVSVIIPYYKKRNFVKETIVSVINQSYDYLEILIIFDDTNQNINKKITLKYLDYQKQESELFPSIARSENISIDNYNEPLKNEIQKTLEYFDGKIDEVHNSFKESKKILELIFKLKENSFSKDNFLRLVK